MSFFKNIGDRFTSSNFIETLSELSRNIEERIEKPRLEREKREKRERLEREKRERKMLEKETLEKEERLNREIIRQLDEQYKKYKETKESFKETNPESLHKLKQALKKHEVKLKYKSPNTNKNPEYSNFKLSKYSELMDNYNVTTSKLPISKLPISEILEEKRRLYLEKKRILKEIEYLFSSRQEINDENICCNERETDFIISMGDEIKKIPIYRNLSYKDIYLTIIQYYYYSRRNDIISSLNHYYPIKLNYNNKELGRKLYIDILSKDAFINGINIFSLIRQDFLEKKKDYEIGMLDYVNKVNVIISIPKKEKLKKENKILVFLKYYINKLINTIFTRSCNL